MIWLTGKTFSDAEIEARFKLGVDDTPHRAEVAVAMPRSIAAFLWMRQGCEECVQDALSGSWAKEGRQ